MSKQAVYINTSGNKSSRTSKADNKTIGFNVNSTPYSHNNQSAISNIYDTTTKISSQTQMNRKVVSTTSLDMTRIIKDLNYTLGIMDNSSDSLHKPWELTTTKYNRFKLPLLNDALQKGFGHVFFVKPNCNLFNSNGLIKGIANNPEFLYAYKNSPKLLNELCYSNNSSHHFMYSLSNAVNSFSLNEEFIGNNTYGTTYTGHKIAYGKNNIESKTASTLSIGFEDDRYLHIFQTIKLWMEYISGVYRGTLVPRTSDIMNKILDYAGACYYILTAEDGETILFWTKFYGIFPTNLPIDQLAWSKGQLINDLKMTVTFSYSFRDDFNPVLLSEFNYNANVGSNGSLTYAPTFDKSLGHTGQTWVGKPYIETYKTDTEYTYKLRFTRT